ncbi:hypothetical protein [Kitasatospora sp. NPDC002965]|uniref:hypothetical protein n=1 Tax=Kitasatospora sp. NPDC002965 TaxID=3154775 RepID=UPI0033A6635F
MTEAVTIDLGDGSTVRAEVIGELNFRQPDGTSADGPEFGDAGLRDGRRAAQLGSAASTTGAAPGTTGSPA